MQKQEVPYIFSKFLGLQAEKQQRILNAAFKEFAANGYKNSSTDAIVKEAGISKGALFHYFKNKKELFLFLYRYAADEIRYGITEKLDNIEADVFVRIKKITFLKLEILRKHPEMYDFMSVAFLEEAPEVKNDIAMFNREIIAASSSILLDGIDLGRFRQGIDPVKAIEIIMWTMDGFGNKEKQKLLNRNIYEETFEGMISEIDKYLEILKCSFYRQDQII